MPEALRTPQIHDETSRLREVVLGHARAMGEPPLAEECYDPKSKESVIKGIYPDDVVLAAEMTFFLDILEKYKVKVHRPTRLEKLNQVFARDIAFAIEDRLFLPNIIRDRAEEQEAIDGILTTFNSTSIVELPEGLRAEGGDVMPWKDYLFIGYSKPPDFEKYKVSRTNSAAVEFLSEQFPHRKVKAFELTKSDTDPKVNALHLDCCFQPIGQREAILYPAGFKNPDDVEWLTSFFGKENIIEVNQDEFYQMFPNIFSISPEVIVSNASFTRLNNELRSRGYEVEEVPYDHISLMGGLLRCSTMPLIRD